MLGSGPVNHRTTTSGLNGLPARLLSATIAAALLFGGLGCELNPGNPDVQGSDTASDDTGASPDSADATTADDPDTTNPDTTNPDPGPTKPDGALFEPMVGCKWADGSWELLDCNNAVIDLSLFTAADCTVQVISTSPVFVGALGRINNNGLTLFLTATQTSCHGFFDGEVLFGACDVVGGVCSFVAQKK